MIRVWEITTAPGYSFGAIQNMRSAIVWRGDKKRRPWTKRLPGSSIAAELYAIHVGGRLKFRVGGRLKCSTHSLRRGGVTTAVKDGAFLKTVMVTGG
jgi:hypothetical protein